MNCLKWKILIDELWMYDSHLRIINDKSNKNWLRNCLYFIFQQVVKIDSKYYFNYVMFQSNHAHIFVSYLYYCKLIKSSDQIQFRHINFNIVDLVKSRVKNQIQNIIFFIDKNINDCTKTLLNMHRFIDQWHVRLMKKNKIKSKMITKSHVSRIENDMFDDRDRRDFEIDWTFQFCFVEVVRISRSQLSHETLNSQKKMRIIVMSWYMKERENDTLKILESDIEIEIVEAHRELLSTRNFWFEYFNHYDLMSFVFSTTMKFLFCLNIENVIIRRKK